MKELLISEYIDNELNLNQKKVFVQEIVDDPAFSEEIIEMIDFEMTLRADIDVFVPEISIKEKKKWPKQIILPLAAAAVLMLAVFISKPTVENETIAAMNNRFVIFAPKATSLHLAGTFSEWNKLEMHQIAKSGYWEINVPLKAGEHRYNFIIDNSVEIVDPTMALTESDDFGGRTSVLLMEG